MKKTRNKNRKHRKNLKNHTRRNRNITGGNSGYDAQLIVWPTYKVSDLEDTVSSNILKFNERYFPIHNFNLKQRTAYIDDLINLLVNDGSLVEKGVYPVVHRMKGKYASRIPATKN